MTDIATASLEHCYNTAAALQITELTNVFVSQPVSDMIFKPMQIISVISHFMTLQPGDVIACGTSLGASRMLPGQVCILVTIIIIMIIIIIIIIITIIISAS
jgi:2-keto-4-pentenoate hydratase/2-oxohepta-3-ene-1,7-dioic acid hydratase in catechol pathway